MRKEPKFFCESCGKEVKRNARLCPHCGKFFASVRCPACEHVGSNADFKKGCPVCGYAVFDNQKPLEGGTQKAQIENEHLPWWLYALSFSLMLIVVIFIISYIN